MMRPLISMLVLMFIVGAACVPSARPSAVTSGDSRVEPPAAPRTDSPDDSRVEPPAVPRVEAPAAAPAGDVLYVNTGTGLAIVEATSGAVRFTTGPSVPGADWKQLFASESSTAGNRVVTLDSRSGAEQASVDVDPSLVIAAASRTGRRVALAPSSSVVAYTSPPGRASTTLVVADPTGRAAARAYALDGNYEPEAFSTDDQRLFVLEYLPPQAPDRYRVRSMDLLTGRVQGLFSRDKSAPAAFEEEMRGTRRMHAFSPDHKVLYTLYTHQPDHLHGRDLAVGLTQSRGNVHAFVHVLNLEQGWAYCVDLPEPFGLGPATAHALALKPDGSTLYVSDRSSGMLARVETNTLTVTQTVDLGRDALADTGAAGAAVGPDGTLYLSSKGELTLVEPTGLTVVRRWSLVGITSGLAVSPDGQRVYLGLDGRLAVRDTATGRLIRTIGIPDLRGIERVLAPSPAG